jgi:hypothetical protein
MKSPAIVPVFAFWGLCVGSISLAQEGTQQGAPAPTKPSASATAVPDDTVPSSRTTTAVGKATLPEAKSPSNLQQFRPNALPYRIERKTFGPSQFFKRMEILWVVRTTKPKAFIVVATNLAKPRLPMEDRQWYDFAEKNNLGFMSIGFDELDMPTRLIETANDLQGRILRLADEVYGPGLKGAFFASGRGGYWMHRVVMRQPWRWGFWCSRDVASYPLAPRNIEYPPGLILSTAPAHYDSNLFFFQDLRRSKNTNRVGFACIDGRTTDAAYMDRFAQQYLSSVLAGGNASALAYDIHTEANCMAMEKPPAAVFQTWVPGDEVPGAWKLLHQQQKRVPDSKIALADARLLDGKLVKLVYRVPGKVRQGVAVRHVAVCILWAETDEELQKRVQSSIDFKASIWNRDRVGIIAINAKALGFPADEPKAQTVEQLKDLRQRMAIYAPEIWKVVGKANGELGWPNAQFHLVGSGIGASIAQALAYADASRILSVHLNGGGPYLDVDPAMSKICWLLTTGGKNAGYDTTLRFHLAARKAGWPVMFNHRSGSAGALDDWVWASGAQFFNYTREAADLLKKEQIDGTPATAKTPAALLTKRLSEPILVMDVSTRKFLLPADASHVLAENQVSLPSIEFEEAWRLEGAPKQKTPPIPGARPVSAVPAAASPSTTKPSVSAKP